MKNLFKIAVTPETSPLVQTLLFQEGYAWASAGKAVSHADERMLGAWTDYAITCGDSGSSVPQLSMEEFLHWIRTEELPERAKPLMVGDREATVNEDGSLKVGCQTITLEQARAALVAMEAKVRGKFQEGDVVTFSRWEPIGNEPPMNSAVGAVGEELEIIGQKGRAGCYFVGPGWEVPERAITLVRKAN